MTQENTAPAVNPHGQVRPAWLAQVQEAPIDPMRPIIDAHHHLWLREHYPYLMDGFAADLGCGHNIRQTVYIESLAMHRAIGPGYLRPVGETEFANGQAAIAASGLIGPTLACAGIVTYADLRREDAPAQLDAHLVAGNGRLRGVRQISAWHAHDAVKGTSQSPPQGLLSDPDFRRGFAELARRGLSFDAWLYFTQLDELAALAKAFPDTMIALDHVGGPLGVGPYAGQREVVAQAWQEALHGLKTLPNVYIKLSGLGMRTAGFDFHTRKLPPTSTELATAWQPYFDFCIETFGPGRCMFASNFPVDKGTCSYAVLWNAHQRIVAAYSSAEQDQLFHHTAQAFYRLAAY